MTGPRFTVQLPIGVEGEASLASTVENSFTGITYRWEIAELRGLTDAGWPEIKFTADLVNMVALLNAYTDGDTTEIIKLLTIVKPETPVLTVQTTDVAVVGARRIGYDAEFDELAIEFSQTAGTAAVEKVALLGPRDQLINLLTTALSEVRENKQIVRVMVMATIDADELGKYRDFEETVMNNLAMMPSLNVLGVDLEND